MKKRKYALKNQRAWLERQGLSNSFYELDVDNYDGDVSLTLGDCNRRITWSFGSHGSDRGIAKVKKVKAVIDSIHDYLTGPTK